MRFSNMFLLAFSAQMVSAIRLEGGFIPRENVRLRPPVSAVNGMSVPEGLCDTVESVSGFFPAGKGKEYFYWAFESRNDPKNDPVVLWMTGGPGCSSMVALFEEHGPCKIEEGARSTKPNPYSWNAKASIIYIDQPSGVGFSRGPGDETGEWDVAPQMYTFLQSFFEANEHLRDNDFYIFGESYGGHYVPAVASYVNENNKKSTSGTIKINLKGIGIGNGLTDPLNQYPQYPEFAYNNTYKPVINKFTYAIMKLAVPACTSLISACEGGNSAVCLLAAQTCNVAMMLPIQLQGLNQYDIRESCENPPLCYDFSNVAKFVNRPEVRSALGVASSDRQWQECNMMVNLHFLTDWMQNYTPNVTSLLRDGLRVLIYAGEADYICNWYGNRAWTLNLEWSGKEGFNKAGEHEWTCGGTTNRRGIARAYGGLTFVSVQDAGHMVPYNQPEAAQALLNTFLENKSFY